MRSSRLTLPTMRSTVSMTQDRRSRSAICTQTRGVSEPFDFLLAETRHKFSTAIAEPCVHLLSQTPYRVSPLQGLPMLSGWLLSGRSPIRATLPAAWKLCCSSLHPPPPPPAVAQQQAVSPPPSLVAVHTSLLTHLARSVSGLGDDGRRWGSDRLPAAPAEPRRWLSTGVHSGWHEAAVASDSSQDSADPARSRSEVCPTEDLVQHINEMSMQPLPAVTWRPMPSQLFEACARAGRPYPNSAMSAAKAWT